MTAERPAISGPGEGERLEGRHRVGWVKALCPELHLVEFEIGPEYGGRRPHFHERHADSFYVLDGELELRLGPESLRVGAGSSVVVPPGVVHAFTNPARRPARFLNIHAPESGLVEYMRALARGENVDVGDFDIHHVDERDLQR